MPSFSMVLYISPSKFAIFLVHGLRSMSSVILVDCVWVFISKKKLVNACVPIMSLNAEDLGLALGVKTLSRI